MNCESLSIGFTGHRRLDRPEFVAGLIDEALGSMVRPGVAVTAVASAASGGDTLFLEKAVLRGFSISLVLPFARPRFQQDFAPEDWQRVVPLFERASRIEEVQITAEDNDAYMLAGRRTVDLSDVLIAVWDGEAARGLGGTGDVVAYARGLGKPLIWINPVTGAVVRERFASRSDGMKRILSLDGGGLRGVFSLQILAKIEELFRERTGNPRLVLADVFDLIAGTSTGAIIAACLSWGMTVVDIEDLYLKRGGEMFKRERWYLRWKAKYRSEAIARCFQDLFRDGTEPALLGSTGLKTRLLIVMRNATTGSPWPVSNNPNSRYNDRSSPHCNLNIPIWKLLRASTAAPSFFPPEEIVLDGKSFLFVDGGMTPFNNPALIAVLMATLPDYGLSWPAGRALLHVTSVGTGAPHASLPHKHAGDINLVDQLQFLGPALLGSVAVEQDLLCRVIGDCVQGAPLDSEIGDLRKPTLFTSEQQKFTYVRYDATLEPGGCSPARMDDLRLMPYLKEVGRRYAARDVHPSHFDPRPAPK